MKRYEPAPSIFRTFSARFLAPEEVARSFVPSSHFDLLSKRAHSLIVGPRGSGKTTLLKMLQGKALTAWKHDSSDSYRERIDYTGVFVPTDITWSTQMRLLGHPYLEVEERELFAKAAFTTHVLHSLVEAILFRVKSDTPNGFSPHRSVQMEEEAEKHFVRSVSKNLYLDQPSFNLIWLKHILKARIGQISTLASQEKRFGTEGRSRRLAEIKFLHIDFFQAVAHAVEVFSDLVGEQDRRWALLFDELELAPTHIVQELVNALRSADQRILLKLSFSPFNQDFEMLEEALSAMPGHDFEYIALWYENKDDNHEFSLALLNSMLADRGLSGVHPEQIFGYSRFEPEPNRPNAAREKLQFKTNYEQLFTEMRDKDISFKRYLEKNSIEIKRINSYNENRRASDVRKIYNTLAIRNEFRASDKDRSATKAARSRSRKAYPNIYSGTKTLFDMLEGNPRWFIGAIGPLLDEYRRDKKRVTAGKQLAEIKKVVHQFRSLLSTHPVVAQDGISKPKSVSDLLDEIGKSIHKLVVLDKFQPEPRGSFIVDSEMPKEIQEGLSLALNAGAIVYVRGPSVKLILRSLERRRFRLTHLLAPHYKLPVQLMREQGLSNFLSTTQLSLFGEEDD